MRRCTVVLAFLIVLALAVGGSASATSTAPGSFLKQRVSSVPDLCRQVKANSLVSSRYTHHFGTSRQALVEYFQDNLKLSTLRRPTLVTVYYINKSNQIKKGKRLLPTGTQVFMTKTGEPVLDWRCGNPLRASLPVPARDRKIAASKHTQKQMAATPKSAVKQAVKPATMAQIAEPQPVKEAVEKVLGNPPTEIATLPFATAPAVAAETVAPTAVAAMPAVAPPVVEAVATAPTAAIPPVIASGGGGRGFLLPLALLGGLGAAVSGGGGGSDAKVVPPPTQPVPEPTGLAALATGMLGMAGLSARRLRRR